MALSHFSLMTIGFLWGLYLRRWVFPAFVIGVFHWCFYALIWGRQGKTQVDFLLLRMVSAWCGITIGYMLARVLNLRRVVFLKRFVRYGLWVPLALLELLLLHAVLVLWELNEVFGTPINYIITFVMYAFLIMIFYFINRNFRVWNYLGLDKKEYSDDYAVEIFHAFWALFQLLQIIIFVAIQWAAPSFFPFWISLIVFGVQLLLLLIVASIAHGRQWKILRTVSAKSEDTTSSIEETEQVELNETELTHMVSESTKIRASLLSSEDNRMLVNNPLGFSSVAASKSQKDE